ncbi:hypothetical protein [Mycobacterium szulgai]|uniref:Uncharacterized protein n=1 Tax=Mycobacterium szulgai TaxID=1787 RepID=A0A1X2E619_MYCSZ|nr:hypothetical protein [Mycobacterium szulgai]MCV7076532.1 hypothetical protein [Mycobacterium szulgai]ORW95903.1 hypothetical protein AWC27_05685 [Mycobacterium szulgai]
MNVISYIYGDRVVTDYPACSARPLAAFVQSCNDLLAGPSGYLSPEDSLVALELGWQTVGTSGTEPSVIHAWVAELLTNPTWGVVQYAKLSSTKAIYDIAELHRLAARSQQPTQSDWENAYSAAVAESRSYDGAGHPAGTHALRSAYESTALADDHHQGTVDAVTGSALRAHAFATGSAASARFAAITHDAIASWRQLASVRSAGGASSTLTSDRAHELVSTTP